MSLQFSKTFPKAGSEITVQIWSAGAEPIEKFVPVLAKTYKTKHAKLESNEAQDGFVVLAYAKENNNNEAIGGMLFMYQKNAVETVKMQTWKEGVVPTMQRRGVGSRMYDTLKLWANENPHITEIESRVDEGDVAGMLFMDKQEDFSHRWAQGDEVIYQWWKHDLPMDDETDDDDIMRPLQRQLSD